MGSDPTTADASLSEVEPVDLRITMTIMSTTVLPAGLVLALCPASLVIAQSDIPWFSYTFSQLKAVFNLWCKLTAMNLIGVSAVMIAASFAPQPLVHLRSPEARQP